MRTMYDGIDSDAEHIPTTAQLVAGYVDGDYVWSAADWARFPHSVHVGIAVHAGTNAGQVLDVENGDASPAQSVDWTLTRRLAGADPTVYCGEENTLPLVQAAFQARGVIEPHYWVANYDGKPLLPVGAVAKQYSNTPDWDLSVVADYWPGVDPAPAPTPPATRPASTEEDDEMQQIEPTSAHPGEYAYGVPAGKSVVTFGCDGYGGKASARVVLWGPAGPVVHDKVTVGGPTGAPSDHFTNLTLPSGTYQVTVRREDDAQFPISVMMN